MKYWGNGPVLEGLIGIFGKIKCVQGPDIFNSSHEHNPMSACQRLQKEGEFRPVEVSCFLEI